MYDRKFIIKVIKSETEYGYIKYIYENSIGYFYQMTHKIENAKFWKYEKNCRNNIEKIQEKLDPTKKNLKKYSYDILEITDDKILRKIKLEKLNKK